ncbi:ABC transporter transmembrane region family protein [Mycobacterium ulcerans str. Harvey]|uniref:ABC transporter transmembrane region family protein n=1 Tax=Mycobacterium ulcerans str. Harvey TaxID=1299332 RepID=A0ABN0QQQ7_MYCUL|nr:ABC transporter transmembrane region family protein [Mycobacterium ulcerans str. Harvey]
MGQARLLNVTVQRTVAALRADVEHKLHRLPLSYFDGRQRGELLSRVTNDIDNIQSSLSMTISQLVTAILTVVAVLSMMVWISPLLALITLLTVPLSLLVTRAITRRSQRLFVAHWTSTGRLNAHIEETYSGFTVVKTFGHQAAAREQFHNLNDDVYQASFGAQLLSALVQPATTFIGNLGYVAVAVMGACRWPPVKSHWAACRRSFNMSGNSTHRCRRWRPCTTACSPVWPAQSGCSSCSTNPKKPPTPRRRCNRRSAGPAAPGPDRSRGVRAGELCLSPGPSGDPRLVTGGRTGQHGGDRRTDRCRQDHAGQPADAVL